MKILRWTVLTLILGRIVISVASDKGLGWDFANYYNAGARIYHGQVQDLYNATASIAGRPPLGDGRQIYYGFPISAYLYAPLGAMEPRAALVVFKLECALLLLAALALIYPLVRDATGDRAGKEHAPLILAIVVLLFAPFWFVFEVGGQATPMNLLLLILFYRSYVAGEDWPAALWLSLTILVKPVLALGVVVFLFAGEIALLWRVAVLIAIVGLASLALLGWPLHVQWLQFVLQESSRLSEPWWNNSSIPGLFYNFWYGWHGDALTRPWPVTSAFQALVAAYKVAVLGLYFGLVRQLVRTQLDVAHRRHHLAILAMLLPLSMASIVWPHYLAFLFLPLALILARADQLPRPAAWLAWLILISTLAVQSRFAQRFVVASLSGHRFWQALVAALFGACTLLLLVAFLASCYRQVIAAQRDLPIRDGDNAR